VARFMGSFPSPTASGMTWSVLTSGPYLDMLYECEYDHFPRIDLTC
jgi:hypothetical protein